MKKELVLAIYDREYTWIENINKDIKITKYNKNLSNILDGEIMIIPNVGRDVHTFFYHIVKNYDFLSDYIIFSQDFPFDHVGNYVEIINGDVITWDNNSKQKFGECWFFNTQYGVLTFNQDGSPEHPGLNILPVWNELFSDPMASQSQFAPAGHFCVSKEHIRLLPKSYYEKIKNILETNEKSPWIIERLEPYIFNPNVTKKI